MNAIVSALSGTGLGILTGLAIAFLAICLVPQAAIQALNSKALEKVLYTVLVAAALALALVLGREIGAM